MVVLYSTIRCTPLRADRPASDPWAVRGPQGSLFSPMILWEPGHINVNLKVTDPPLQGEPYVAPSFTRPKRHNSSDSGGLWDAAEYRGPRCRVGAPERVQSLPKHHAQRDHARRTNLGLVHCSVATM